jgi:hypothetical protein
MYDVHDDDKKSKTSEKETNENQALYRFNRSRNMWTQYIFCIPGINRQPCSRHTGYGVIVFDPAKHYDHYSTSTNFDPCRKCSTDPIESSSK